MSLYKILFLDFRARFQLTEKDGTWDTGILKMQTGWDTETPKMRTIWDTGTLIMRTFYSRFFFQFGTPKIERHKKDILETNGFHML